MKKNIFLIGEKGVGKSTILSKLITYKKLKTTGFSVHPYYIEGIRQGFYMAGHVEVKQYNNYTPISVQVGPTRCVGVEKTFETLGVEILEESLKYPEIILMDELGKLERSARYFQEAVKRCLDSPLRVIGVIKACDEPWLLELKNREDVTVIDVSVSNREGVLKRLLEDIGEVRYE